MKSRYSIVQLLSLLLIAFLLNSCGNKSLRPDLPAEERMRIALEMFEKGDYLDAKTQFRIITLSHSGSAIADKAQFYLAECHYHLKEYILAANEYERLIKMFPNSEWVDDAKYKLGMSYFKLSPKYYHDQEYTMKAIREFQEFLEDYPNSELFHDVEQRLNEAREKLAHKIYAAAEQYRKIGEYRAAIIYYTLVLERYFDSSFAPLAQYQIGECYRKLHDDEKAIEAFSLFLSKFPQHEYAGRAKSRVDDLKEKLAKGNH